MEKDEELYQRYYDDPTPDNLRAVVDVMKPTINHALISVNGIDNPALRSQAKIFAAQAVRTYNPTHGAALRSWIATNLMQMRRAARAESTTVKVPERTQLDMTHIHRVSQNFLDQHGRDPDSLELADATGFSLEKIAKLRRQYRPVATESAFEGNSPEETGIDYSDEAMDYIYRDADHADRTILEHLTGYHGAEVLPANQIAAKLKMHPSQVTRRAARLSLQIENTLHQLEKQ